MLNLFTNTCREYFEFYFVSVANTLHNATIYKYWAVLLHIERNHHIVCKEDPHPRINGKTLLTRRLRGSNGAVAGVTAPPTVLC